MLNIFTLYVSGPSRVTSWPRRLELAPEVELQTHGTRPNVKTQQRQKTTHHSHSHRLAPTGKPSDLLPVSSTVIPLSIYKVGYEVSVTSDTKHDKLDTPAKLITVNSKKKYQQEKTQAKIKQVSKAEFEKQKSET
nr:PREDICTED: uncharacterized protein LOC109035962 isoform X1 [Bemisia tabaci]